MHLVILPYVLESLERENED